MPATARSTASFPTARLASRAGGLPVEVTLIAQLGHGAGDRICRESAARQRGHTRFADALDEPAATLAATDIGSGETTALHSFAVGPQGHPFHRHAGHRVFTAVSGSGGAQLRFCTASDAQVRSRAACLRRSTALRGNSAGLHVHGAIRRRHLAPIRSAASRLLAPDAVRSLMPYE